MVDSYCVDTAEMSLAVVTDIGPGVISRSCSQRRLSVSPVVRNMHSAAAADDADMMLWFSVTWEIRRTEGGESLALDDQWLGQDSGTPLLITLTFPAAGTLRLLSSTDDHHTWETL
ncbi:hypothetical protein ACOMHN_058697 [Nucella lapillus]